MPLLAVERTRAAALTSTAITRGAMRTPDGAYMLRRYFADAKSGATRSVTRYAAMTRRRRATNYLIIYAMLALRCHTTLL